MQRQAVPFFGSRKCTAETKLECQTAIDSRALAIAKHEGKIIYTNIDKILPIKKVFQIYVDMSKNNPQIVNCHV